MNHDDPYLALALLDLPPRATTSRASPLRAIRPRASPPPEMETTKKALEDYGPVVGSFLVSGK
jgi:hypothetical protein